MKVRGARSVDNSSRNPHLTTPGGYDGGVATMGPTRQRDLEGLAGNVLRVARAKTGLTPAQLARLAGVPRSTVERIEAGTRQPSLVTMGKLLAAVDLDLRIHLEPYDGHDDVLDANYAAMTPAQQAATDARHEAMVEAFRAAGIAARAAG